MLAGVIEALRKSSRIDHVAFVSAERDTIPAEFPVLPDEDKGLNAALDDARRSLMEMGADELLVLPADLPSVAATDIDFVVESGRQSGFALVADAAGRGTNALFLRGRAPFRFRFGADSCAAHLEEARRAGCTPTVVDCPGLSFDVDEPEDLDRLLAAAQPRYTFLIAGPGGNAWPLQRAIRIG